MYNGLRRSFIKEIREITTKIRNQQRSITSSTLTGIYTKTGNIIKNIKEERHFRINQKANFSTGKNWNPFYVKKSSTARILEVDGNSTCPDCSSSDVYYVSTVNGGVYCPVCAGIHRELGTHPDFVTLNDDIHVNNEDMQFYESMGNNYVNNVYEAALDVVGANKPTVSSSRDEIIDYIKKKYLECRFSVSRHDRSATENVLYFVSNMRVRGEDFPDLREKTNERAGYTYKEIMDEAFDSPYGLVMAE
eukprot:Seg1882.11 transcript_id=Seg1882.11/GoldUCD/mRNA.D3Y31 product="Arf-GAP with coiled-coil ANK repeat and PH domain-containing protein 3" protein_id=Seg1882.11/GoldUCD/D3Y31